MGGAHVSARGERGCKSGERHHLAEKAYSVECAKGAQANWARQEVVACGEGRAGVGRAGPVGLNPMEHSNGKLIFEFQWNLKFGKTLGNSTRRFRRNLNMGIFHNSSRLLMNF
jgi:hypothetical protein